VPLVLLLTGTVSVTSQSHSSAADLLVDGLLELLVVEDGPDLPVAVAGPERCVNLNLGLTDVRLGVILLGISREFRLSLGEGRRVISSSLETVIDHLLQSPLQDVPPEPLEGLGGDEGSRDEASADHVGEDPHSGLRHWGSLLELSEHPPQQSLVVVGEGGDGSLGVGGASGGAVQLVEPLDAGKVLQDVPLAIVNIHSVGHRQEGYGKEEAGGGHLDVL